MKPTLTEIIQRLDEFIIDTKYDLEQDWNEEKGRTQTELQLLLQAKASLELLHKTGGQIFHTSIKK